MINVELAIKLSAMLGVCTLVYISIILIAMYIICKTTNIVKKINNKIKDNKADKERIKELEELEKAYKNMLKKEN